MARMNIFDFRFRSLTSRDESSRLQLLVRVAIGAIFAISGIVKFLYENQGSARFAKLGFPPGVAAFVGVVEIVGGLFVTLGLLTRLAALSLTIDMAVAILTTKLPILFGAPPEPIGALPKLGIWAFAYQARLDICLLVLCAAIVLAGAGAFSIDAMLARRGSRRTMGDELPAT